MNPLVSIVILTYNSSVTIKETLESIKKQTYKEIELIITDDCSSDETVSICKAWLIENACRFVKSSIVTSSKNSGVSSNANRGIRNSSANWIKTLAGDDLLKPYAIQKYVDYTVENNCQICFAPMEMFGGNEDSYDSLYNELDKMYAILKTHDRKKQYRTSLWKHILPGPGLFFSRQLFDEVGGFDETYSMSEEQSFEIEVFKRYPVYFLDDRLVLWRQRSDSLCHNPKSQTHLDDTRFFYKKRRWLLLKEFMLIELIDKWIDVFVKKQHYNSKRNWDFLYFLSPKLYIMKIKSILKIR